MSPLMSSQKKINSKKRGKRLHVKKKRYKLLPQRGSKTFHLHPKKPHYGTKYLMRKCFFVETAKKKTCKKKLQKYKKTHKSKKKNAKKWMVQANF